MEINSEVELIVKNETLSLPEFKGFTETLKQAFSLFSDRAPADSSFTVRVQSIEGGGYRIAVQLASDALKFTEEAHGMSPFTTLDGAIVKTRRKLDLWAAQKNILYH